MFEGNTTGQPCGVVVALPCVAQFVIVLDVTIVAIALPVVQSDLGLSTTLPLILAAWAPTLVAGMLGLAYIFHREDG